MNSNSSKSTNSVGRSVVRSATQFITLAVGMLVFGISAVHARGPEKAAKKTPEQYWAEAGVNKISLLSDGYVSNVSCSHELIRFLGCYESIRIIVGSAEGWDVIPSEVLGNETLPKVAQSEVLGDGFTMVRYQPMAERGAEKDMSLRQLQKLKLDRTAVVNAALSAKFANLKTAPVDFPKLVNLAEKHALTVVPESKLPLIYGNAISGFLTKAIDAHARITPLAMNQDQQNDPDESFVGIGATLKSAVGKVVIVNVLDGGAAKGGGLKANDVIVSVDNAPTEKQSLDNVISKIRGPEGTQVRLEILRNGEIKTYELVRKPVQITNVNVKVENLLGKEYLVISLKSFMDANACQVIKDKAVGAISQNPGVVGVIFDLRSNGGGRLDQGVCITSLFVGRQTVVKILNLSGGKQTPLDGREDEITKLPLVTLIDSGSASASEIFAGAVQDHKRSWLVGERSFGKGSVQSGFEIDTGRILGYATTARFYQPSGRTNQIVGILPDFEVSERPNMTEDERFALREIDYYPEALPAVGEPWVQPRAKEVAEIKKCTSANRALAEYEQLVVSEGTADYQKLYAAEVIGCQPSDIVRLN